MESCCLLKQGNHLSHLKFVSTSLCKSRHQSDGSQNIRTRVLKSSISQRSIVIKAEFLCMLIERSFAPANRHAVSVAKNFEAIQHIQLDIRGSMKLTNVQKRQHVSHLYFRHASSDKNAQTKALAP